MEPERTVRIEVSLRSLLLAAGVFGGLWLLTLLWPIAVVVVVAAILAGTLAPIIAALEDRHLPRTWAVILVFVAAAGLTALLVVLIVPPLGQQMVEAWADVPNMQARLAAALEHHRITADFAETVRRWKPHVWVPEPSAALASASGWVESAGYVITSVVLALYLVADRDRARGALYAVVPRSHHIRLARILIDLETIVGGYMRGQLITSFAIAVFAFVVLKNCHVPGATALAVFAGVTDVIPYVGGLLASGPAVVAALSQGTGVAITVLLCLIAYQELESRILVPRIYGQALRLPPAGVLVALLVGGKLLGIVGAFLALPVAAGLRIIVEEMRVNLPGDASDVSAQREIDEEAERSYAEQTSGAGPVAAAAVASRIAGEIRRSGESSKIALLPEQDPPKK